MLQSVLVTAFQPYDSWPSNASWLALVELTRSLPVRPMLTTRLYPVDYACVRQLLARDLADRYDAVLHLGQAPGSSGVRLESLGINVAGNSRQRPEEFPPLVKDGPAAYQSQLPLGRYAAALREAGIPAEVSHHAGTYLCNATLYLTHHLCRALDLPTRATFVHLPLDPTQVDASCPAVPSLPACTSAAAVRMILEMLGNETLGPDTAA